ncbi:PPC domain-containing DNA-binding protein [Tannockella kyphosi]|uniref:PPC domain-containing DNA-binding protein n=1 Tax=Tannockella kyphosi TaxID=2899121 RepID=UPI002012B8F9|nr:PPC domain-containing DNA-binding protein [Tannockella kyphosi]
MKTHVFRLVYNDDIMKKIDQYVLENNIQAGCILSGVGCIHTVCIRKADGVTLHYDKKDYEIVSLMGTVSLHGSHLHISLSDNDLCTIGGHLMDGCLVNTTCEIVILEMEEYCFTREMDENSGYEELMIKSL